jgi:predicted enzyme related to lactoylglutathione lyase
MVHWEVGGRGPEHLRAFYADLFGWKIDPTNPEYGLVETGDGIGGGIMRCPEGVPPHVTIYVQVDSLEAALDRVGELGGQPLLGADTDRRRGKVCSVPGSRGQPHRAAANGATGRLSGGGGAQTNPDGQQVLSRT